MLLRGLYSVTIKSLSNGAISLIFTFISSTPSTLPLPNWICINFLNASKWSGLISNTFNKISLSDDLFDIGKGLVDTVSGKAAAEANEAAMEQATKDSIRSERRARSAEVFAQTEGKGSGALGKIELGLDEDEDEEELGLRQGKSSLQLWGRLWLQKKLARST